MTKTKKTKTDSKWVLVTSGKCDNCDPLFENPSPDIYASKRDAITAMKNDVSEFMHGLEWNWEDIAKQLDCMGREMEKYCATSVDLNDSYRLEYSLWRCPVIKRVKTTYTKMVNFCKGKK